MVPLFNPRTDPWDECFDLEGSVIVGLNPVGRATARLLAMNDDVRIEMRAELQSAGGGSPKFALFTGKEHPPSQAILTSRLGQTVPDRSHFLPMQYKARSVRCSNWPLWTAGEAFVRLLSSAKVL